MIVIALDPGKNSLGLAAGRAEEGLLFACQVRNRRARKPGAEAYLGAWEAIMEALAAQAHLLPPHDDPEPRAGVVEKPRIYTDKMGDHRKPRYRTALPGKPWTGPPANAMATTGNPWRNDPNNMVALGIALGAELMALCNWVPAEAIELVDAPTWKGRKSREALAREESARTRSLYPRDHAAIAAASAKPEDIHDLWHAVALYRWKVGQLRREAVATKASRRG